MGTVVINDIRGIKSLEFKIPRQGVYVVTGENGVGKSTLFTCLNRICDGNAFRDFKSSQNLDEFKGSIKYIEAEKSVTYTRRDSGRWQPDSRNNNVLENFSYPSTVHISTNSSRIFVQDIENARSQSPAEGWLTRSVNDVLDTDKFSNMIRILVGDLRGRGTAKERRRNTAFAIPKGNGDYYTERNFSFGEIVLINLLYEIENMSDGSLVMIDELEMALHPSAQIRLVKKLEAMAKDKNLTILISTHSASIIKSQSKVILLDMGSDGVDIIYNCPPAKAIGAIGMKEDTTPDIIVLVEDDMGHALFTALQQKYKSLCSEAGFLDIRVIGVGGYANVIQFFCDARGTLFYDNVYLAAYLDKDVETDIVNYEMYGNREVIQKCNTNQPYIRYLPYTPEVLLCKVLISYKSEILTKLRNYYSNQTLGYSSISDIDFNKYETEIGIESGEVYKNWIEGRGGFRKKCKEQSRQAVKEICEVLNVEEAQIYRFIFQFAVDREEGRNINVRELLAPTMKRLRPKE